MNYQNIYDSLIIKRKANPATGYVEKHHIIPKSLGGSNDSANLVVLTGREHWVAHLLLWKIKPCSKTVFACHRMSSRCKERGIPRIKNSRMYEVIRENHAIAIGKFNSICNKGDKNHFFGKIWISNNELKVSKRIYKDEVIPQGWDKGRNNWKKNTNKKNPIADETLRREKISLSLKTFLKNNPRVISNQTKCKMGLAKKGNNSLLGMVWINDGKNNKVIKSIDLIPAGFVKGKLPRRC
jgi:hypothetical protein